MLLAGTTRDPSSTDYWVEKPVCRETPVLLELQRWDKGLSCWIGPSTRQFHPQGQSPLPCVIQLRAHCLPWTCPHFYSFKQWHLRIGNCCFELSGIWHWSPERRTLSRAREGGRCRRDFERNRFHLDVFFRNAFVKKRWSGEEDYVWEGMCGCKVSWTSRVQSQELCFIFVLLCIYHEVKAV